MSTNSNTFHNTKYFIFVFKGFRNNKLRTVQSFGIQLQCIFTINSFSLIKQLVAMRLQWLGGLLCSPVIFRLDLLLHAQNHHQAVLLHAWKSNPQRDSVILKLINHLENPYLPLAIIYRSSSPWSIPSHGNKPTYLFQLYLQPGAFWFQYSELLC